MPKYTHIHIYVGRTPRVTSAGGDRSGECTGAADPSVARVVRECHSNNNNNIIKTCINWTEVHPVTGLEEEDERKQL